MNPIKVLLPLFLALPVWLSGCSSGGESTEAVEQQEHEAGESPEGPHGGRLLTDGEFGIEVTIFESGVPPEFRIYPFRDGQPLSPTEVNLSIQLSRFDGRIDTFTFAPRDDHLVSNAEVEEPHSFDVTIEAEHARRKSTWTYESYEARTTIAADMARISGIETEIAGPGMLRERLALYGRIEPNPERVRNVSARFPGVIRSVTKQVGDVVRPNETLATVESNESLQTYNVTAPIGGVVTERMANPGESATEARLFVIADFSTVWAELSVFPRDRARMQPGQEVTIAATDREEGVTGTVAYITPTTHGNQSLAARVILDNPDRQWTPGMFVAAEVTTGTTPVPLAVKNSALQSIRDWTVVFINIGETYEARPLTLGRTDGQITEVLAGLTAGDRYVVENSYLIKADIEKSGASHDH
jgi:cobalt-zinc-cadmium efflux system membrane fusion protein